MTVTVISTDGVTKVKVEGRVDTTTAVSFQNQMEEILNEHKQSLMIDCEELKYLSSAGLRVFFILFKRVREENLDITLQHLAKNVHDVLRISGFDSFFKIEA